MRRSRLLFAVGWLALLALHLGAAPGAQTSPDAAAALPEGQGKSLVMSLCTGCHTLETAVRPRATPAEWRQIVESMVQRGARVTPDEAAAIASYLGEHYGPTSPASGSPDATRPASAAAGGRVAQPAGAGAEDPGKALLTRKCFQCHAQGMWSDLRQDRRGWEAVLYRMVGRGALWTEAEIATMADYLARTYPAPADKPR
jgi:cytochrome c5